MQLAATAPPPRRATRRRVSAATNSAPASLSPSKAATRCWPAVAIVIGERLRACRRAEQRPRKAGPVDRRHRQRPARRASRLAFGQRPVVGRDRGRPLAQYRKAEGPRGEFLDADGDILQRRLAGNRVGERRGERVDAAPRRKLVRPVHRREDAAFALACRDQRADAARRRGRWTTRTMSASPMPSARHRPGGSRRRARRCAATGAGFCRCASSCASGRARGRC